MEFIYGLVIFTLFLMVKIKKKKVKKMNQQLEILLTIKRKYEETKSDLEEEKEKLKKEKERLVKEKKDLLDMKKEIMNKVEKKAKIREEEVLRIKWDERINKEIEKIKRQAKEKIEEENRILELKSFENYLLELQEKINQYKNTDFSEQRYTYYLDCYEEVLQNLVKIRIKTIKENNASNKIEFEGINERKERKDIKRKIR